MYYTYIINIYIINTVNIMQYNLRSLPNTKGNQIWLIGPSNYSVGCLVHTSKVFWYFRTVEAVKDPTSCHGEE